MKRIFLLLAFFSCFLILSISFIPSAQSTMVEDEINNRIDFKLKELINDVDNSIPEWLLELLYFIIHTLSLSIVAGLYVVVKALLILYSPVYDSIRIITDGFINLVELLFNNQAIIDILTFIPSTIHTINFLIVAVFFFDILIFLEIFYYRVDNYFLNLWPIFDNQIMRYGIE